MAPLLSDLLAQRVRCDRSVRVDQVASSIGGDE
jgi:hypothetical protein